MGTDLTQSFPRKKKKHSHIKRNTIQSQRHIREPVLPADGIRITPQTRRLMMEKQICSEKTVMGCWLDGKILDCPEYKERTILKTYYITNCNMHAMIQRFNNYDNFLSRIKYLKDISGQQDMVPMVRALLREVLIPELIDSRFSDVMEVIQTFVSFGIKFMAYTHYRKLLTDGIKKKSVKQQHEQVMKYGPVLYAIRYDDDTLENWLEYKNIISAVRRYHQLKYPDCEEESIDGYIKYGLSFEHRRLADLMPGANNVPVEYILDPMIYSLDKAPGEILTYPYDEYKKELCGTKYQTQMKGYPIQMKLDSSKKWKIPAASQYFELVLDGSTIKCDGICFMIMRLIESDAQTLNFIQTKTGIPKQRVSETLDKLLAEGIIIKRAKKYQVVSKFKGDDIIVIM